ncbi:nitrate reductase [bacterium]|nr:MAG: nitrate reductase [bacterium]
MNSTKNPRHSPGQSITDKFPTVGEKNPSPDILDWKLEVVGLVKRPLTFSWEEFSELPKREGQWDTICVTGWTRLDDKWGGVGLAEILGLAEPLAEARFVRFVAYSTRDHDTSLPLEYANEHVILATELNGEPLSQKRGGPVRSVCGGKYFYKSLKWVRRIELLAEDKLGYWEEVSSYHNNADPWKNERYSSRPMATDEFAERVGKRDFSDAFAVRDEQFKQLNGVDLSGGRFERAQIKGCPLHYVVWTGANCSGANFTLCNFAGADLRDAILVGADLEGANLQNADLRGADLRGASLTAAKFVRGEHSAKIEGARFLRSDIENEGLSSKEQAFLLAPEQGAIIE